MFLPIDPHTGEPEGVSFEAFASAWQASRHWMVRHRAGRLARRLRHLSDAQLRDLGLARLNAKG
jgi:uncharacterized protein YjiS (DUF1127 family)